jgi:hypothetical protein
MERDLNSESQSSISTYRGFRGLQPLVGLHSMEDALRIGLSVSESVSRLKRLHWSMKRLHTIFVSRLTSTPIYELKMAFSLHALYCAEHMHQFAERVKEMRQPPYGLEVSPNQSLDVFFDEVLNAPTSESLVVGLYQKCVPAVVRAIENLMDDTNRLFDHPTWRLCRLALVEMREVAEYGSQALDCLVNQDTQAQYHEWTSALDQLLARAGDLDGELEPTGEEIARQFSATPYTYDPVPNRDERFQDLYNMGVNAEAMLFDPRIEARPKTIMLYFKRMREIDVPEMMASIIVENPGKSSDYIRDMTRQMWDEARHAMMGEVGFVSLGVDWSKIPFNFTWSLGLNTKLSAKERHAVLYAIEQGLMPRTTGKEFEWEVAIASASPLASLIQDYDWADEVLHAKIGRRWLVPTIGSQEDAMAAGDVAWSKVLVDWKKWKDAGLTQHRNWWPEIYITACQTWNVAPDPRLLAFDTSYEHTRADLKDVSAG